MAVNLNDNPPISPLLKLWRLMLLDRLHNHRLYNQRRPDTFWSCSWRKCFQQEGLTAPSRLALRDLLKPCVRVSNTHEEAAAAASPRLKDLVDWEIVLGADHVQSSLQDLIETQAWRDGLPALLAEATCLLRDALDLMRELDGATDMEDHSCVWQPSIGDHPQNERYRDWTFLIELTRDSWLATAKTSPKRARLEVERWLGIPYPTFKRLAFFAAAHGKLFAPDEALRWLLIDDCRWLWSSETQREALRLLVALAPRLSIDDGAALQQAILEGPPPPAFSAKVDRKDVWFRLAKYRSSGAALAADAEASFQSLSRHNPEWQLAADESDEFSWWMSDDDEWRTFLATPKLARDLAKWLVEHPTPKEDFRQDDDFRERCERDVRRTLSALASLALGGKWPTGRWREALQAWSDEEAAARAWRCLGNLLASAPDNVVKELADSLGGWLKTVAASDTGNDRDVLSLINRILALYRNEPVKEHDDPVSLALNHPVGKVTEAALRWWSRQNLEDHQGLPAEINSIFTDLCDTRVASFRHGRTLLAQSVIALFRVDPEWTKKHLLPLFDWDRSTDEARAAWCGYLWTARLYWPLMEAIKSLSPFVSTAHALRVQFSEVVGGAVQAPFAPGLLLAPHHEAVGALVFLHLAEHRFHGLAAQAVEVRPRLVNSLRSIRSRALMPLGIRPRGGGASRIALRCFQSLVVAIRYSHSAVSVAALSSDQYPASNSPAPSPTSSPLTASIMARVLAIIGTNWWTSLAWFVTSAARMIWPAVTTAWAL